mgnify:CR=1 FL=1
MHGHSQESTSDCPGDRFDMDAQLFVERLARGCELERGMDVSQISGLCDGGRFAPEPLSDAERAALASRTLDGVSPTRYSLFLISLGMPISRPAASSAARVVMPPPF